MHVEAIKNNDSRLMEALYIENYEKVKQYVLCNNGSIDDVKDIYQESFLTVWRSIQMDKFVPHHEGAFSSYLYQIARNKWIDFLRSKQYKNTSSLDESYDSLIIVEEIEDQTLERLRLLKQAYKLLGDNCRKILDWYYYKKLSMKEIAQRMGWTEATAKNNKYRCVERLKVSVKRS